MVAGSGQGELLSSQVGLSFWGGVDPLTGTVIDQHHPLRNRSLAGRVLAIPSGRGSCSGSGVLLELILNGHAPAAIVICEREEILTLGALVAEVVFEQSIPVLRVKQEVFADIGKYQYARVAGSRLHLSNEPLEADWQPETARPASDEDVGVRLDVIDEAFLSGQQGKAAQIAMRLLLRMAAIQEAESLMDVSQVHIDGCIYTGPASLRFAQMLVGLGARVRVPTTLNAISVDKRGWRAQGIAEDLGVPASALADAYVAMGAQPSFTCAPYLLDSAPQFGEQIGWAESNAVVYANSVIGARTMKYPDYLDICMALTGRAPLAGCHLDAGRQATVALEVEMPTGADDSFWPLLGYSCGSVCGNDIPLILGLEKSAAGPDELKAFGAAFATVAAAPMFHIAGVTPEANEQRPERRVRVGLGEMRRAWDELNTAATIEVGLVSFGNPHFSFSECARLAALVQERIKSADVEMIVTCGRAVHEAARQAGYVEVAEAFGVRFVTDTCWCMLGEPVIPLAVRTLMTNSGKYAHYAPGLVGRGVRFGSMIACIDAACSGKANEHEPAWLL
nr:aconitase X [Rhizobium sp. CFBP 8752]